MFEVSHVRRSYPTLGARNPFWRSRMTAAADDISFEIASGTTLALVGESGSGKSTVARLAVGLEQPDAGTIRFLGAPLSAHRRGGMNGIAMVFQDPYASLDPRWRVGATVAEPLRTMGIPPAARHARVAALLAQVGLSAGDAERYPASFSGGQRQRIAIARALANEPAFLVCDEPTSALDPSVRNQILNLIASLQRARGLALLLVSHDVVAVRSMADHLGVMCHGRLVEYGRAAEVFANPRHPCTRQLLDLDASPLAEMGPAKSPSSCLFNPRCPLANDRCRTERPGYTMAGPVRVACHAVEEGRG